MSTALSRNHRQWLISVLLVALVVRALIPAGFMPATDRPFSFQICPDGFPAHLLVQNAQPSHAAHHHHEAAGHESAGHDGNDASPLSQASGNSHDNTGTHRHNSASSEHCVFAAAAGAGPLAFVAIFSAVAVSLDAPAFFHVAPVIESQRFRVQQPRGPPALS